MGVKIQIVYESQDLINVDVGFPVLPGLRRRGRFGQQAFAVFHQGYKAGVPPLNGGLGPVQFRCQPSPNVKAVHIPGVMHLHPAGLDEVPGLCQGLFCKGSQHFQEQSGVAAKAASGRCCCNAAHPACTRHGDALGILDDVAAAVQVHPGRCLAQQLPRFCSAQRDGNGLGTAHGGHQFILQYPGIIFHETLLHIGDVVKQSHPGGRCRGHGYRIPQIVLFMYRILGILVTVW